MSSLIRIFPGDKEVDFLLAVALMVAVTSSVAWLSARRMAANAALRHLVLLAALICCLATPAVVWFRDAAGLTLVSIPIFAPGRVAIAPGPAEIAIPLEATRSHPATDPPRNAVELASPHSRTTADANSRVEATRPAVAGPDILDSPDPGFQRRDEPTANGSLIRRILTGAMLLWVTGTVFLLGQLARRSMGVVRFRQSSAPARDERLLRLLRQAAHGLGTSREVALLGTDRAIAPLAVGFGRAAIILPRRLLGAIGDDELSDILVHELAHIERGDPWIILLQELTRALYWPIVPVNGLNRELRRASEEVCDNAVLAGRDAINYGETLLRVARLLVEARTVDLVVGIIGGPGSLERRIVGMLDPRRNTMTRTGRTTSCIVTLAFLAGITVAATARFGNATDGLQPDAATVPVPTVPGAREFPPKPQNPPAAAVESNRMIVLRGEVFGPGDRPLAGARLYLNTNESTASTELGTSDAEGAYRFVVPEQTLRRTVSPNFIFAGNNAALLVTAPGLGTGLGGAADRARRPHGRRAA